MTIIENLPYDFVCISLAGPNFNTSVSYLLSMQASKLDHGHLFSIHKMFFYDFDEDLNGFIDLYPPWFIFLSMKSVSI